MSLIDKYYPKVDEDNVAPSKKANVEQKRKKSLIDKYYPTVEKAAPEPEKKKPSLLQRVIPKIAPVVEKAKKSVQGFLFGEEKAKPKEKMGDENYATAVGFVQQQREESAKLLSDAEKEITDLRAKVGPMRALVPGAGRANDFKEVSGRIKRLEGTIKDYDTFLSNEPTKRGFIKQLWEEAKKPVDTFVPFFKDIENIYETSKEIQVAKKFEAGEELTPEEVSHLQRLRSKYFNTYVEKGIGEQAASVLMGMPKFIFEMYLTLGISAPLTKGLVVGTEKALMKKVSGDLAKKIVPGMVANSIKLAGAGSIAIPAIASRTADYMLPTIDMEKELKGDVLDILKPGDAPMKAVTKGYLTNLTDYVTEGVGDYVDEPLKFVKKAFVSRWLAKKGLENAAPGTIRKALGAVHFNSLVGEVFEEEIAEPINALIEGRKYDDPFFTPAGRERLLVEALGIGAFAGMANISDATLARINRQREKAPDVVDLPVEEKPAEVPLPKAPLPEIIRQELAPEGVPKEGELPTTVEKPITPSKELVSQEITAKDLVESKTVTEIQDKLQRIFGTYEELDQLEAKDFETGRIAKNPNQWLTAIGEYMPDIERAANDRDYKEVADLLATAKEALASVPEDQRPKSIQKEAVKFPEVKIEPKDIKRAGEINAVSQAKIISRKSPADIKGFGKNAIHPFAIKGMPNAYTDGYLLVTDRTESEVKQWNEAIAKRTGSSPKEPTQEQIENLIPKTLEGSQKLGEPVDFIEAKFGGGQDQVIFQLQDGKYLSLNAEGWKWLGKQGYELHASESKKPVALFRNNKIAGVVMPIHLSDQFSATIKANAEKRKADQGIGGVSVSRQPADIVPQGESKQAGVGKAVEVNRGEVARGERPGGDLGAGERSRTRLEEIQDELPEEIQQEAEQDWIDNHAEAESKRFNKVQKLRDELKKITKVEDQQDLRKQIRELDEESGKLEEAFVNKWKRKTVENTKPVIPSKAQQADINEQVELLVAEKGTGEYSEEEKSLLRQYTGAGGLEKAGAEGRGLLDEYYTPKPIVDFIWKKIEELKPKIDLMLEPSAGIGNFLEGAENIKRVDAREINKTASTIAYILYPKTFVSNRPFESMFVDLRGNKISGAVSFYDLVIGNPPYGEHRGKYLGLGEEPKIIKYEEYFMKRGLDILKKDGVMAYVVPSGFLRSDTNYAKSEIAKLGELVDAYRLPNGVFGTTTIGTDIVFFRKSPREEGADYRNRLQALATDTYFNLHPDKILGEISKGTGNYGADEVRGTLEQAIRKTNSAPREISDTIQEAEIVENGKSQKKEIDQSVEATKSTEPPPTKRIPQTAESRKINERAIIEPKKKDTRIKLNDSSEGDLALWRSVTVTGELNDNATAIFDPKTFVNNEIAISFEDNTPKYYPNILYYQGNIYEKLDNLELFRSKISPKQYEVQKVELQKVLPTPQTLDTITLQPIADFVKDITVPIGEGKKENIMELFDTFLGDLPYDAFGSSNSWEVIGYINGRVVNTGDKAQNVEVRKRRREVGNDLFKRFIQDALNDEQKKHIEKGYNRNFNSYFRPDYRQVPILSEVNATFNPKKEPGRHPLEVKAIQREGVAFLATKGVGLLAWDVGVGKTMTGIIAVNEVLKRGWAKRPLVVVPNGVYKNWINESSEIIPDVKINSLMNLGGGFRGDLKTLEIGDGTISLMTIDGLVKLGFRQETYDELTKDLKDVMLGMNNTKRAEAKQEADVEKQIGRAIKGTTDQRFFEDLGFDHVTFDEAHFFKNIFAGAKLEKGRGNEFRNVSGSSSARAIKAYLMARYVLKNNNNRNAFLLTATPFTNSPLEIYSIISLMAKKRLENLGLKNVNDFMSLYMQLKPKFVVKADQSVKEGDVIENFQNLQELQKIVTEFIDFRTGEEAGIDRPGRIKRTIILSPTQLQVDYIKKAQSLFADKTAGQLKAIGELQNITLSPYLSRYNEHSPTYKEFVENSPKIKYAVEAIAQVHKDNKEVGQVLYMPRGISQFHLIREYLIKEKGFKPGQIGEIIGGMTMDAKDSVREKFNAGEIKVLMGSEAIMVGMNLQERSTDLYHLHLPWNPSDMLQVEGRIHRQGNDYANVRIHYPLIENSVDSFIFQKLETKEKRIKNLWSYKGREIEVGDLDFENMKLDLITDPVLRVSAEKTFEMAEASQKLIQLKVEKSFAERRITKLKEVEEEVTNREEGLADALKDEDIPPEDITRRRKYLAIARGKVTAIRNDFQKRGIDVAGLETKFKNLEAEVIAQEKVASEINKKYEVKFKEAEKKADTFVAKPNNYPLLIRPLAMENASFFVKRRGQEKVRATDYRVPGGAADIGGYADIESAQKTVENIRVVEFPELLRIARSLTGQTPALKRFRRALGRFYEVGKGVIKLHPDIFKDPKLAAKVFAHEIGHLADYLPDKTLAHGNILGRIANLNKFLKGKFGEREIDNVDIRMELKDLSQAWKPFDELANPAFTSFRYSSRELYADAMSTLFNDPALLKEKAPTFFKEFFAYLKEKPEVREEFNKTWDLLNAGDDELFKARNEEMNRSFESGEKTWVAKTIEKQKLKTNVFHALRTLFDDRNFELNRRVRQAAKEGNNIEDRLNPEFEFAGLNYLDGPIKNFVLDNFQPAYQKAAEVGEGWNTVGKILQLERAIYERGDLANPGGFDKNTSKWQLDQLEKHTDPGEWKAIQEAKTLFRSGVEALVAFAEKNGYYTPQMIEQMKANPAYATFQVVDYLDTYVSPSIHKQKGTLKDIANPATSTIMKAISTFRAIEYNNAKTIGIDFQREFFKDEVKPAKTVFTGKFQSVIDPSDPTLGKVIIIRNGKVEGYYLPKEVADVFNRTSSRSIMLAARLSRMFTGSQFYRPIFTTINLGFQTFNIVRDFMRFWKNIPDMTILRALQRYGQAAPHALRRVLGKPDELVKAMENSKILGLSYNAVFIDGENVEEEQIKRVLQGVGILEKTKKRKILTPIYTGFEGLSQIGNFIESLPKIAGYIDLKGRLPEKELAYFIRTAVGSPDFRVGGTLTPVTNNLFLFSNAYKEGMKTDLRVALNPKSRSAFWWKTIMANLIPKALMAAMVYGLFGDWLKERMADISEYDKTNYIIIPIGVDENGKTIYSRVPTDETGRFFGGMFWKLLGFAANPQKDLRDLFQVIDFGAGQTPNLAPSWTGANAVLTYLSGRNPYDQFRGRYVIPDQEFKAGPKYSFPVFLDWLVKNQGLSIIMPSYTPKGNITELEKFLSVPGMSNIFGRWVKVSTYGQTEELRKVTEKEAGKEAGRRLDERKVINEAVKKYREGGQGMLRRREIEREVVREIVGKPPYKAEEKAKATNTAKKFRFAVLRGEDDPNVNALLSATSNDQKKELLKNIRGRIDEEKFKGLTKMLLKEKIVSKQLMREFRREQ